MGGSAKGAVLDEALLLDTDAWSLTRVPPPPPPTSATSAGGGSAPWARAHGALLALPQLALHVGGAKSLAAPPCDALDLQTMSWREVEIDTKSAALLGTCRLKHGLARTTYRTALDGCVTATALLYGGEFPPGASPDSGAGAGAGAAGQSPARFCRVRVREMPAGAATPETSPPKVSSAVAYAASRTRAACAQPSTVAPPSAPSAPSASSAPSAPPSTAASIPQPKPTKREQWPEPSRTSAAGGKATGAEATGLSLAKQLAHAAAALGVEREARVASRRGEQDDPWRGRPSMEASRRSSEQDLELAGDQAGDGASLDAQLAEAEAADMETETEEEEEEAEGEWEEESGEYDGPPAGMVDPEEQAAWWVGAVTGREQPEGASLQAWLKSGVVLCELMDLISPEEISPASRGASPRAPSTSDKPFRQMENIAAYAGAARRFGVPEPDMFVTVDLFEGKNIAAVVRNLHSLGRVAQQRGFVGPQLGVRLASRNVRTFSQAQLDEAKAMPARWTNRGNTLQEGPPSPLRLGAAVGVAEAPPPSLPRPPLPPQVALLAGGGDAVSERLLRSPRKSSLPAWPKDPRSQQPMRPPAAPRGLPACSGRHALALSATKPSAATHPTSTLVSPLPPHYSPRVVRPLPMS